MNPVKTEFSGIERERFGIARLDLRAESWLLQEHPLKHCHEPELKLQFVPRSKHTPSRLNKAVS